MSDATPTNPAPASARPGLLLSRDLIFVSKITGTAQALGQRMLVAGNSALAASLIEQEQPRAVIVDLGAGDLVAPPALERYRALAGSQTPFIAFGSHVDTQALAAARASGCDPVMPRSRFTTELVDLIQRYLIEDIFTTEDTEDTEGRE